MRALNSSPSAASGPFESGVTSSLCRGVLLWTSVGRAALERGAAQIVVVTARLDEAKRAVLAGSGLSVASEWWVRPLSAE